MYCGQSNSRPGISENRKADFDKFKLFFSHSPRSTASSRQKGKSACLAVKGRVLIQVVVVVSRLIHKVSQKSPIKYLNKGYIEWEESCLFPLRLLLLLPLFGHCNNFFDTFNCCWVAFYSSTLRLLLYSSLCVLGRVCKLWWSETMEGLLGFDLENV